MEQARLNVIWDQLHAGRTQIGGIVGRASRDHDYLVDLTAGTLWSRSHETDVWREVNAIAGSGRHASHTPRSSRGTIDSGASPSTQ